MIRQIRNSNILVPSENHQGLIDDSSVFNQWVIEAYSKEIKDFKGESEDQKRNEEVM